MEGNFIIGNGYVGQFMYFMAFMAQIIRGMSASATFNQHLR